MCLLDIEKVLSNGVRGKVSRTHMLFILAVSLTAVKTKAAALATPILRSAPPTPTSLILPRKDVEQTDRQTESGNTLKQHSGYLYTHHRWRRSAVDEEVVSSESEVSGRSKTTPTPGVSSNVSVIYRDTAHEHVANMTRHTPSDRSLMTWGWVGDTNDSDVVTPPPTPAVFHLTHQPSQLIENQHEQNNESAAFFSNNGSSTLNIFSEQNETRDDETNIENGSSLNKTDVIGANNESGDIYSGDDVENTESKELNSDIHKLESNQYGQEILPHIKRKYPIESEISSYSQGRESDTYPEASISASDFSNKVLLPLLQHAQPGSSQEPEHLRDKSIALLNDPDDSTFTESASVHPSMPTYVLTKNMHEIRHDQSGYFNENQRTASGGVDADKVYVEIEQPFIVGASNFTLRSTSQYPDIDKQPHTVGKLNPQIRKSDRLPNTNEPLLSSYNYPSVAEYFSNLHRVTSESPQQLVETALEGGKSHASPLPILIKSPDLSEHEIMTGNWDFSGTGTKYQSTTENSGGLLEESALKILEQLNEDTSFKVSYPYPTRATPLGISSTPDTLKLASVQPDVLHKVSYQLLDVMHPSTVSSEVPVEIKLHDTPQVFYSLISTSNSDVPGTFQGNADKNEGSSQFSNPTESFIPYTTQHESLDDSHIYTSMPSTTIRKPDIEESYEPTSMEQPDAEPQWLLLKPYSEEIGFENSGIQGQTTVIDTSTVGISNPETIYSMPVSENYHSIGTPPTLVRDYLNYVAALGTASNTESNTSESPASDISVNNHQSFGPESIPQNLYSLVNSAKDEIKDHVVTSTHNSQVDSIISMIENHGIDNIPYLENRPAVGDGNLDQPFSSSFVPPSESHLTIQQVPSSSTEQYLPETLESFTLSAENQNASVILKTNKTGAIINSWSVLESLVNSSDYTPPTLALDCEMFGPLSPVVEFYGSLFPNLRNPCEKSTEKPSFQTEEYIDATKQPPSSSASTPGVSETTMNASKNPTTPSSFEGAFIGPYSFDALFDDFNIHKNFTEDLAQTFSSIQLDSLHSSEKSPLPSEEQLEEWWKPLHQITSPPVLKNFTDTLLLPAQVENQKFSISSTTEIYPYEDIIQEPNQDTKGSGSIQSSTNVSFDISSHLNSYGTSTYSYGNKPGTYKDIKNVPTESSLAASLTVLKADSYPTATIKPEDGTSILVRLKGKPSNHIEPNLPDPAIVFGGLGSSYNESLLFAHNTESTPLSFWNMFSQPLFTRSFSKGSVPVSVVLNSTLETKNITEDSLFSDSDYEDNLSAPVTHSIIKEYQGDEVSDPPVVKTEEYALAIPTEEMIDTHSSERAYETSVSTNTEGSESSKSQTSSGDIWGSLYKQWVSISKSGNTTSTTEKTTLDSPKIDVFSESFKTTEKTVPLDITSSIPQNVGVTYVTSKPIQKATSSKESSFQSMQHSTSKPLLITTSSKPYSDTMHHTTLKPSSTTFLSNDDFRENEVTLLGEKETEFSDEHHPIVMNSTEYPLTEQGVETTTLVQTEDKFSPSSQVVETTKSEFSNVLGSLWELMKKDDASETRKTIANERYPNAKFTPVRNIDIQSSTEIPLYTIHNLTTTIKPVFTSVKPSSPVPNQQVEGYTSMKGLTYSDAIKLFMNSTDHTETTSHSTGTNDVLTHAGERSKTDISSITSSVYNFPEVFGGEKSSEDFSDRSGHFGDAVLVHQNETIEKSDNFARPTWVTPKRKVFGKFALTPQIPPPTRKPIRVNNHHLLYNHRPYNTPAKPASSHRPVIIVKKKGHRFHIPVIPSADFSSFKSFRPRLSPQARPRHPLVLSKSRHRPVVPAIKSRTGTLPIVDSPSQSEKVPFGNLHSNKPRNETEYGSNNVLFTSTYNPIPANKTTVQGKLGIKMPYVNSAGNRKGCGSLLLDRLEYLLGRELVMDQIGVGVYSSVVESILSVECGLPNRRVTNPPQEHPEKTPPETLPRPPVSSKTPQPLRTPVSSKQTEPPQSIPVGLAVSSQPFTQPTTLLEQISPPPSILPTIGMEGWLSIDDLRKQEKTHDQEQKESTTPKEFYVEKHRLPFEQSPLSPMAAFLSAMPSSLPVFATTVAESENASAESEDDSDIPLPTASPSSSSHAPSLSTSSPSIEEVRSTAPPNSRESSSPSSTSTSPLLNQSLLSFANSILPSFNFSSSSVLSTESSLFNISTTTQLSSSHSSETVTHLSHPESDQPISPIPRNSHKKVMRRAVGMAVLNSLAVARAIPLEKEDDYSKNLMSIDPTSRALGTNVFGFETILTALVYLSFGIFLYQMIQRAVEARGVGLPFPSARSWDGNTDRGVGEEYLGTYFNVLHQALEKVPNAAAKIILEGEKAWKIKEKTPECLPYYICQINYFHHHQERLNNATSESIIPIPRSSHPHAMFTSALSTLMSMWSGENTSDLVWNAWTGALGLPCVSQETSCMNNPNIE